MIIFAARFLYFQMPNFPSITTLRVFCRERAPVGGISVKAHFEINLVPITIGMTYGFYKKIMAFYYLKYPLIIN